jgi:hypothetical protein
LKRLLLALIFYSNFIHAQHVLVKKWDYRYGGNNWEGMRNIIQTADKGFIWGGSAYSGLNGDFSEANRNSLNTTNDYWIVKVDSLGIKQWDKRYGGVESEYFRYISQTNDGGFIIGGFSDSDSGWDRSEATRGSLDYWIVKIDCCGNKQWDKRFGGADDDLLWEVKQTMDGGYILGGFSHSGIGGDRTEASWGHQDYWIVKTDSLGNKIWDKRYGGGASDNFYSLVQANDGGYILAGSSIPGLGGDYSTPGNGNLDYWVVKIDSVGNKQWDKSYGGYHTEDLGCVIKTSDGNFLLGGISNSGVDGNKSAPSKGLNDYWIIKIDPMGSIIWDKAFGGFGGEILVGNMDLTTDNGFLIGGLTYSIAGGDKTENNLGLVQPWIVKIDYFGNLEWEKTMLVPGKNNLSMGGFVIQSSDRCFVSANNLNGGVGGYRTQPNWDVTDSTYDQWVVKFCDTILFTSVNNSSDIQNQLSIFPNPFVAEITVSFNKKECKNMDVVIRNILGEIIFQDQSFNRASASVKRLDLGLLLKGIYFLETNADGERSVRKIVKQ